MVLLTGLPKIQNTKLFYNVFPNESYILPFFIYPWIKRKKVTSLSKKVQFLFRKIETQAQKYNCMLPSALISIKKTVRYLLKLAC